MVRLFEEPAARRRVTIRLLGASYEKPPCHDSFETIALVLVDNAVKYSLEGREIRVGVNDAPGHCVQVTVESYGPVVPEDLRKQIFDQGRRAPSASRLASQGTGLGLHIASVVAEAHGFGIAYECGVVDAGTNEGWNRFSFEVRP